MRKGDITYQDKLNELRLDISHPNNIGIVFIFVEGGTDIKLFRKFFNLKDCKVENIPGGNTKLEECVSTMVQIYPLIIGIRDADFIHLSNKVYLNTNMFLTDYHDIEMTMLAQNIILNALIFEYTDLPKDKHLEFRDDIIKSIKMVSYLKWLNDKENLELNFSSGFQDLVSFTNLSIDFKEYLKRVISKSKSAKIINEKTINDKINLLIKTNPNMMQLTNGHDLLNVFSKYFREETNHKKLNDDNIASALRMVFSITHLKKTKLYIELEKWNKKNKKNIFVG